MDKERESGAVYKINERKVEIIAIESVTMAYCPPQDPFLLVRVYGGCSECQNLDYCFGLRIAERIKKIMRGEPILEGAQYQFVRVEK